MHLASFIAVIVSASVMYAANVEAGSILGSTLHTSSIQQITPRSRAVSFNQVTFDFDAGVSTETDWGQFKVKPSRLKFATGRCSGYLNVFLHAGTSAAMTSWVVENLRIPAVAGKCCSQCREFHSLFYDTSRAELFSRGTDFSVKTQHAPLPTGTYFDLRPGIEGEGGVDYLLAVVLFSRQPLPLMEIVREFAAEFDPHWFRIRQVVVNAEGDESVDEDIIPPSVIPADIVILFGPPPQPSTLSPEPPPDLAFPIEVFQSPAQNVNAARNQCVPMAYANALQYLEDRYNGLPLLWSLPDAHFSGLGKQLTAGDILLNTWVPDPEISLVANIDALTRRQFATDFNTGNATSTCQQFRGVFGYLALKGDQAEAVFRHQGGKALYGTGDGNCDNGSVDLGGLVSTKEGDNPTWEWIFDQLQKGRAVVMAFNRYDINGNRTSGHMVRVWGAARYNNKNYLYTLDDSRQGTGDFGQNLDGLQTLQWEVADTSQPGLEGIPNGRLEMEGTEVKKVTREIKFAVSIETKPTLLIP